MSNSFTNSKLYKILYLLLNVGLWIAIALSCFSLIILFFNQNQTFMTSGLSFDGFLIVHNNISESSDLHWLFIIITLTTYCSGIICIWMLRNIVNSLKINSPFTLNNVKRMRIIGWTLFIEVYLKQLLNYMYVNELSNWSIKNGIEPILQARFNILPDKIVLVLCILILAEIFKYGCILQSEHDSTV